MAGVMLSEVTTYDLLLFMTFLVKGFFILTTSYDFYLHDDTTK